MTTIQGLGLSPFFQGLQKAVAPRFGGDIFPLAADDDYERHLGADAFVPGASPVAEQAYRDGLTLLHEGDAINAAKAFAISLDLGYGRVIPPSKIYNNMGVAVAMTLSQLKKKDDSEGDQQKTIAAATEAFNTAVRLDKARVQEINERVIGLDRSRPNVKADPFPRINTAILLAEAGYPEQAVKNLLKLTPDDLPSDPADLAFLNHNRGLLLAEMVRLEEYELAAKLRDAGAEVIADEPGYHYFVSE